jgi:hypothetical protein
MQHVEHHDAQYYLEQVQQQWQGQITGCRQALLLSRHSVAGHAWGSSQSDAHTATSGVEVLFDLSQGGDCTPSTNSSPAACKQTRYHYRSPKSAAQLVAWICLIKKLIPGLKTDTA